METELTLSVGGLPPMSARGCTQEIVPVQQNNMYRTINGELIFLKQNPIKYKSIIQCKDKTVLATNDFFIGQEITVGCLQRLWQKVAANENNNVITVEREPVQGSLYAIDSLNNDVLMAAVDGRQVTLLNRDKVCFLSYRPLLNMRVVGYSLNTDEWGLKGGWRLELEEI